MVWIVPRRRSAVMWHVVASQYEDVSKGMFFTIQKLKKATTERPMYRVIIRCSSSYYEVAYCDTLDDVQKDHWEYISTHIPSIIPDDLDSDTRTSWLVAHCLRLSLRKTIPSIAYKNDTHAEVNVASDSVAPRPVNRLACALVLMCCSLCVYILVPMSRFLSLWFWLLQNTMAAYAGYLYSAEKGASVRTTKKVESNAENARRRQLDVHALQMHKAGSSLARSKSQDCLVVDDKHSFSRVGARLFKVRGPDYWSSKVKVISPPVLFEVVGIDVFRTSEIAFRIGQSGMRLPSFKPSDSTKDESAFPSYTSNGVPAMFILSIHLPESTSWNTDNCSKNGYMVTSYFVLTAEGRHAIEEQKKPAAKLYKRFTEDYKTQCVHNRLKCIASLQNQSEIKMGLGAEALLSKYNNAAFMTGPTCHSFYEGDGYLGVDVNIHKYCYAARKGCTYMLEYAPEAVLQIGWLIEARTEEEQPENILGCVRLNKVQLDNVVELV